MYHVGFVRCWQITPGGSQLSRWPPTWLSGFTFLTLPRDPIRPSYSVSFSSPRDKDVKTSQRSLLIPDLDHLSADDHLLLLCSSLQWQVFEEENRAAVRLLAGDNVEISRSLDPCSFNQFIPVNNFLHCRSQKPQTLTATQIRRDKSSKQIAWKAKFKSS